MWWCGGRAGVVQSAVGADAPKLSDACREAVDKILSEKITPGVAAAAAAVPKAPSGCVHGTACDFLILRWGGSHVGRRCLWRHSRVVPIRRHCSVARRTLSADVSSRGAPLLGDGTLQAVYLRILVVL